MKFYKLGDNSFEQTLVFKFSNSEKFSYDLISSEIIKTLYPVLSWLLVTASSFMTPTLVLNSELQDIKIRLLDYSRL